MTARTVAVVAARWRTDSALIDKAAVLCVRLARNHPLPDGNKRLAYLAMLDWSRVLSWLATPDHVRHCYSSRGYRAERREVGGQAGRLHLVEILGLPQALKPSGTEASEADTVREGLGHRRA